MAWPILEPGTPFIPSWHIDAICDHLQACTEGHITRLGVNVPPGSGKSLIMSVMWNAWEWGPRNLAHMRFLSTSYELKNVVRDTRRTLRLLQSEWYQSLWGDRVQLTREAVLSFENSRMGSREGAAFASLTGKRGDRLTIDDPHSMQNAESDADRAKAQRIWREDVTNRVNSQERSVIALIMQRLHTADICGLIAQLGQPFVMLILPMEFEAARKCTTYVHGRKFFEDPRKVEGELLAPAIFSKTAVAEMKRGMTAYAIAGQYQQRPVAREGGLFKRDWFDGKIIRKDAIPPVSKWVRHWDLAATADRSAAFTAGVKMGKTKDGRFVVSSVIRGQWDAQTVQRQISLTAQLDGKDVEISLPQDPGQAGKAQKVNFYQILAGYKVHAQPETGDKVHRAEPFSCQCEVGNVLIVDAAWTEDYIDELCLFPGAKWKDQVDASSGAFGRLTIIPDIVITVPIVVGASRDVSGMAHRGF